jgi:hypothetical protein
MNRGTISALVAVALLAVPLGASADFNDFNTYYKDRGYQTEILLPLHSDQVGTLFWVGRSPNAETFGRAYDHWQAEVVKDGSTVSRLSERFGKCTTGVSRFSYESAQ